jgi:low affinity Fe/Cu permease
MNLALRRAKVYAQVALVALLVCTIAWVLFKNRKNEVAFWFFGLTDPAAKYNVVWVLVWTASTTLAVARIFWFARGLWRNVRDLRRAERVVAATEAQKKRATDLENRQREIDEKLQALEAERTTDGEDVSQEQKAPEENHE